MKKNLTKIFSTVLAAATALSVSAAPLAQKVKANAGAAASTLTAKAQSAPAKKAPGKTRAIMPQVRTGKATTSVFRTPGKYAGAPVKAPYKVGYYAEGQLPELIGSDVYSDSWATGENLIGLYKVPTSASQEFDLLIPDVDGLYGGTVSDGIYYTSNPVIMFGIVFGITYNGYDLATGEQVYSQSAQIYSTSLSTDPTDGKVYGYVYAENTPALATISFDAGEVLVEPYVAVQLADTQDINSIAFDSTGQLWAIVVNYEVWGEDLYAVSSELNKIDKTTGALTKIGETGFVPQYLTDCTFDHKTDRLFWTVSTDEAGLLTEVNTTTGEATVVYEFPGNDEVCGLAIGVPAAEENAPAAVENLALDFEGASLEGTVNFTLPALLYSGAEATGDVNYTVTANGEEVATGSAAYGSEVAANVTLPSAGTYTFVVVASNEAGNSPKAKISAYVGPDTPVAPKVSASIDLSTNVATVTWTPVTAGVNGGYFDAAAVTYDVTRYPGGTVVAQGISETVVTDQLPAPEGDEIAKYFYEVVAKCGDLTSEEGLSNYVIIAAPIVPPYVDTFDEGDLSLFTVIDANGDGKVWSPVSGAVRMSYNASLDMDDWLISPAFKLEAGKLYDVAADLWCNGSSYPERIEVMIGKAPNPEAMTTVILEPTLINQLSADPMKLSKGVSVDADGIYYIGFHAISYADSWYLYLDNFSVSAPLSTGAPAAVTDLNVVADPTGALVAEVSFSAPATSIAGDALASLEKIELSRNGEVINTWNAPAPGAALTYTDNAATNGDNLYSVVAYNADGAGYVAEMSVYCGYDLPVAPTNVTMVESEETLGVVTVSWDAVTEDVRGNQLPASEVTYQVYAFEGNYRVPVSDKISETSFTLEAVAPGEQTFAQYAVFAYTSAGEGEGDLTQFEAVGTPYTTFSMTSSEDLSTYILGMNTSGGGTWGVGTDETFSDINDADGTNFYLFMHANYLDDYATIFTGKIDLSATVNPGMQFYTMPIAEDDDNPVKVIVTDLATGEETVVLDKKEYEFGEPMTWNRVNVNLAAFAGKTVSLTIYAECQGYAYALFDGWSLVSLLDYDLAASIEAPAQVEAGSNYNVDVTVANVGTKETALFSVQLYADGELVDTKPCEGLQPDQKTVVTFERSFSALAVEPVVYTAKIIYASDENTENDEASVTVAPIVSNLPVVSDLEGKVEESAIVLTWSEPDLEHGPAQPVTEDFEDAEGFSATYGDWIFVDLDQSPAGGFQGEDVPGITPGETTGSFWIWDTEQIFPGNPTFESHSGTKYLFALFRYDGGTSNEWAISPALDGYAQTISFYAKSYSSDYPEKIEVYYSTGSTDPADFVKVEGVGGVVPGDWTLYEAQIPSGATRFAIRSCATDSFMLMVDDVTYAPAGAASTLDIVGYNVYRDGVKINDAVVEETTYTDANVEEGKTYDYVVVAVYTIGESAASNVAKVTFTVVGIDNIYSNALNISAAKNSIIVTGAKGLNVAVYTVDGKTIFSGAGEAKNVIPAQQGVYVVKAGETVKKVLVK